MKTNYHTHHVLCRHAKGHVEDYVKEAIKAGYTVLGMSDHGPLHNAPFKRMNLNEFKEIYLKEINESSILHKDEIKLLKGLEIEYVEGNDEYYMELLKDLDYLILGCHFYSGKKGYEDKSSYGINTKEALEEYTALIEEALDTKFFKILAHPDLFLVGYPSFDAFAEECAKRIIKACIRNHVIIEFNANGLRRGQKQFIDETNYAYPNNHFFQIVKQYGGKVIVGSDCHDPKLLDDEYMQKARLIAKEMGLDVIEEI